MKEYSNVTIFDHILIQHKVAILRDKNTSQKEFRELVVWNRNHSKSTSNGKLENKNQCCTSLFKTSNHKTKCCLRFIISATFG